ncbi:MAG: isocitrate lyase/PEP mutase family protein [Pseudomonadota bacterium]
MHRWTARRQAFRAILNGDRCVRPASTYDPLSTRIAEDLGFEVGMLGGSVASLAVLGAPDLIVLTLSELADQVGRISRAGNLPLMVDADHGYGNSLNAMRTVEELELAGAAGLSLEDTLLPRRHGAEGVTEFIPVEEGVAKLKAALGARNDPDLAIVGRTDTAKTLGAEEAAKRARAYAATGVDAIFLVGVQSMADLKQITADIDLPLILGGTGADMTDAGELAALGARVWLQGHQPIAASARAIYETMKHFRDGGAASDLTTLPEAGLMDRVSRKQTYADWMEEFL